jgi:O-antigen/teichoic acid export membrane protein
MPFMTMQVLFSPACDARGKPSIGMKNGAFGAAVLAASFLVGVQWGPTGIAAAWIVAYPIYLAVSMWRSLPVIGARLRDVADAVAPPLLAAVAMALVVTLVDHALPPLPPFPRLALLASTGAAVYGLWLVTFSRHVVREIIELIRLRRS